MYIERGNCNYSRSEWVIVTQSCSTLCDPMSCSLPGSSVYGIFQARILEWVAISFSKYSHKCLLVLFPHPSCQSPYESTRVSCLSLLVPKHPIQLSYFLVLFFHLANCFINILLRIFTYLWNNWHVIFPFFNVLINVEHKAYAISIKWGVDYLYFIILKSLF